MRGTSPAIDARSITLPGVEPRRFGRVHMRDMRRASTISRAIRFPADDVVRAAHPHPTTPTVFVALRQAQRPVWAPGVRILSRPPIIRRRSRTSSIVDRAPIAWVRWGGPTERRRSPHRSHQAVRSQETTPSGQHRGAEPTLTAGTDEVLAKSSVLDVSDHCTPTPWCRCRRRPHPSPAHGPHRQPG